MITRNFEDFPDHRLRFFALLHSITIHCFKCLFAFNPSQLKLVIDSIVWAMRWGGKGWGRASCRGGGTAAS